MSAAMSAPPSKTPEPMTLAAIADGSTTVPTDWQAALADHRISGLTGINIDLDAMYNRPLFEAAREEEADGHRALRFRAAGQARGSMIASVVLFSLVIALIGIAIAEYGEPDFDNFSMVGVVIYSLIFGALGFRTLVPALIRTNVLYAEDQSARHGVRLEGRVVSNRVIFPRSFFFNFQPAAILVVNRHFPGEVNIPMNFARRQDDRWSDAAVLAVGTNSEFAVIGCHRTLELAREVALQSEICTELTACGVPILEAPPRLVLDMPVRPPLPDERRQWKREKADIDLPPLTPEELHALFAGLSRRAPELSEDSFTSTTEVLQGNNLPVEPTTNWLQRAGVRSDREVMRYTALEWGEWAQWEPETDE